MKDLFRILLDIRALHQHQERSSLPDDVIKKFLQDDKYLQQAVESAGNEITELQAAEPEAFKLSEQELIDELRSDILNFYSDSGVFPYVPLVAYGPWIVTFHGGVIYEIGSYGMLGFGHNPDYISPVIAKPQTMANVKTVGFSQKNFTESLKNNIRQGACPYEKFLLMNSGSEAVAVATRVSDSLAYQHRDKKIKFLSLEGGFHGRTARGAMASDSTLATYKHLASFSNPDFLDIVEPNNIKQLEELFKKAKQENVFYECMLIEPVMGEGRAGFALSAEFYQAARRLCDQHETLLLVDSIQAGLRCHGVLSILDYPGFEELEAPDMETYSKALNAGQYPLSVLALSKRACAIYQKGTYGNTMTANPRGLDLAIETLGHLTPEIQKNIVDQGRYAHQKMQALKEKYPSFVGEILGTGLLFSLQLTENLSVEGDDGIEKTMRTQGINVIHGSGNRLRFTPWFEINQAELDLVFESLNKCLNQL